MDGSTKQSLNLYNQQKYVNYKMPRIFS